MRTFICIVGYLLMALSGGACDCKGPDNFIYEVNKASFVFKGEIVENTHTGGVFCKLISKVRVLEILAGQVEADTILICQGSNVNCMGILKDTTIGAQLLVTGSMSELYTGNESGPTFIDVLEISSCGVQSLVVKKRSVHGMITKDKYHNRLNTIRFLQKYSLLRFFSEETRRKQINSKPEVKLQMSLRKVKRMIRKRYAEMTANQTNTNKLKIMNS